ncbi:DUF2382 domain-containing protein [Lysobacter korlensis]|uniref:DUF2382 domain-containing protein n=1 Tax=Lysobacter korlensis TaxID=553636 RepID=A0ABV6RPF0_9GAMM
MDNRNITNTGNDYNRTQAGLGAGTLQRLDDLDDFKVADGDPDIRGWSVRTSDGRKIGEVDSLIVDTTAMQVRYLDIDLDRKALDLKEDRHVLVPIGGARLDDDKDDVLLTGITGAELLAMPPYRHGQPVALNHDTRDHDVDAKKFYGNREGSGRVERLTLSEEELRVGKRTRAAGEAHVHKTVETRHVSEKVPLKHEELVIETRPLQPGTPAQGEITDGEVRIPLMAEEVVVDKQAVAREEVVIRKKVVEDEKTIEADLRRERLDVDRTGADTSRRDTRH